MKLVDEHSFNTLDNCQDKSSLLWKTHGRKLVAHTQIFDMNTIHRTHPDGRSGDFVEIAAPSWVNTIPYFIGSDGVPRFVMERQFRHGSDSVTIEFPGGIVEKGEDPQDAALRELEEETGIRCHKLTKLGDLNTNPAFMSNRGHFYLAEELEDIGTRHFDENEQIDVITIPCTDVLKHMGTGDFDNGVMVIALFLFEHYLLNTSRAKL